MAGLTTLALLALSAADTAGKYVDQRRGAGAAVRQGDYEGDILDQNAGLAQQQAADSLARGREAEGRQRAQGRQLAGAQRAAFAASGVEIDSGSAADVMANDHALDELDAMTIRNNAAREAWGYQVQSNDYRRQADLARMSGRETASSLRSQSVSTLLTGAGSLASIYASAPKRITRGGTIPTVPAGSVRPTDPRRPGLGGRRSF
jgi:hypothetical protein